MDGCWGEARCQNTPSPRLYPGTASPCILHRRSPKLEGWQHGGEGIPGMPGAAAGRRAGLGAAGRRCPADGGGAAAEPRRHPRPGPARPGRRPPRCSRCCPSRPGSAPHGSARPGPAPPAAAAPRGAPRRHGALQAAAREGASCAFVTAPGHRAVTAPPHVDGKPAWPGVPRLLSPIGCPEPGGRVSHF